MSESKPKKTEQSSSVTVFKANGHNFHVERQDYDYYIAVNGNLQFRWTRNIGVVPGDEVWVTVGEDKYIFIED